LRAGRVFAARLRTVEFMAEGQLEPSGSLLSPKGPFGSGRVIAVLDPVDDLLGFELPGSATAEVDSHTDHWSEFS